jgi:hypothetical protein
MRGYYVFSDNYIVNYSLYSFLSCFLQVDLVDTTGRLHGHPLRKRALHLYTYVPFGRAILFARHASDAASKSIITVVELRVLIT